LRWNLRVFDKAIYKIIADRQRVPSEAQDVLSVLLRARDERTGQGIPDKLLRDHVVTFFLAGHEPGAVVVAWTCFLLAANLPAAERLQAELTQVLAGRTPSAADLKQLPFLNRVIQESIRLYPSIWQFVRDAVEDDEIDGFHIPKKSTVFLSPYITHHHPDIWDNPETFDPDRFLPERIAKQLPFAYFPFAGGPHLCIAKEFVLMHCPLIVAMIMQAYRLQLAPGHVVTPEATVAVRPREGIFVTAHSR
jgi:cytochrome P450